jgi:hypothetical protein
MSPIKSGNFKTVDKSKTNITMEEEVKVPQEGTETAVETPTAPEAEPQAEVVAPEEEKPEVSEDAQQ